MAIRADAHIDEFHRDQQWHKPVRVATTATITIATALNAGDTIDGVTLADGDRVLVKNQATGSQNGIYVVDASPFRAYDMLSGNQALGAIVYVIDGTANGGKAFRCTVLTLPTIGSTSLVWGDFPDTAAGSVTVKDEGSTLTSALSSLDFVGAGVVATNSGGDVTVTISGGGGGGSDMLQTASGQGNVRIPGAGVMHEIKTGSLWDGFDTTDTSDPMTGWTTLGSPTAHDMNSTVRSHYYVNEAGAAGVSLNGIYKSWAATDGDYVECWLTGDEGGVNGNYTAGLFIGEAGGAGKITSLHVAKSYSSFLNGRIGSYQFTNRTTFASEPLGRVPAGGSGILNPIGLRIKRESSTVFSYWYSWNGKIWIRDSTTVNPGYTVGIAGLFVDTNNAGARPQEAIFDWFNGIVSGS